ncbi:patatin-like phospholipase family protein [uncultured Azohydromonas sp.]|uniref:patatin-like phospholipase family protein n=1 Tax=uncultured Azohydromonas sp. TaxID=487342 RepID=UPI0026279845|nr:patatin-like phospholipase family protein [uncultured Azohydromonas sp.]
MRTVVVFQGGGALGAFGGGAWASVAPWLRARGDRVVALAGTSIGAVNAAVAARQLHTADAGVQALLHLWRHEIATPSFPFLGFAVGDSRHAAALRAWNGLLTGMLLGTRNLYRAQPLHWLPWAGASRMDYPLYDRGAMWSLLERQVGRYASVTAAQPLLAAGAVDLLSGELRLFDSDEAPIGAAELAASSAIPMVFEPVEIGGRHYWDGDVTRDSLLPGLLARLRASGRLREGEALQLVSIEQFPRAMAALPRSGAELRWRAMSLMQVDKLVPPKLPEVKRWIRITRPPLPEDAISADFDYSPERLETLITQGRDTARAALVGSLAGVEETGAGR